MARAASVTSRPSTLPARAGEILGPIVHQQPPTREDPISHRAPVDPITRPEGSGSLPPWPSMRATSRSRGRATLSQRRTAS